MSLICVICLVAMLANLGALANTPGGQRSDTFRLLKKGHGDAKDTNPTAGFDGGSTAASKRGSAGRNH